MAMFNRKRYFIDKPLQTKYIVLTILMLLIYTLLFVLILIFPHILALSFETPLAEQTEAAKTLLILHKSIWPALGIVILIMSGVSILITHKVAGPVYRFKQTLAEISKGNLDITIKLREKDDLKDLAEEFNNVISEFKGVVTTLQKNHDVISSCIEDLNIQIKNKQISSESGERLIKVMKTNQDNISDALSKYSRQE